MVWGARRVCVCVGGGSLVWLAALETMNKKRDHICAVCDRMRVCVCVRVFVACGVLVSGCVNWFMYVCGC